MSKFGYQTLNTVTIKGVVQIAWMQRLVCKFVFVIIDKIRVFAMGSITRFNPQSLDSNLQFIHIDNQLTI